MEPTLRDGDWLLVDADAYRHDAPRAGQLVVAADPRALGRSVVKRVQSVESDCSLVLAGDHRGHLEDELRVDLDAVRGRPWLRYWPPRRVGHVG
jgi:signal peptidase I